MTITLYTSTADPKVVNKSSYLTQIGSASVIITPKASLDILYPVIDINYNASYLSANYAYISDFGRYYYINDVTVQIGQIITLSMDVDPLMSFQNDILDATACITRSESIGGPTAVNDDKLPVDPNKKEMLSQISDFKWLNYAGSNPNNWRTVFVSIATNPTVSP